MYPKEYKDEPIVEDEFSGNEVFVVGTKEDYDGVYLGKVEIEVADVSLMNPCIYIPITKEFVLGIECWWKFKDKTIQEKY